MKLYQETKEEEEEKKEDHEDDENILPDVKNGDELKLDKVLDEQHFTNPPPRYSEASLVKKLEEH